MNEETKETSKKIHRKKAREEQKKKQGTFSNKLKTEEDKRAYVGEKLRTGRADLSETREEKALASKLKKQSRNSAVKKTYDIANVSKNTVGQAVSQDSKQDNNGDASAQIVYVSVSAAEDAISNTRVKYSRKLHDKKHKPDSEQKYSVDNDSNEKKLLSKTEKYTEMGNGISNEKSREIQKIQQKKKIQKEGYAKHNRKTTQAFGHNGIGERIKEFFDKMLEKVVTWVADNPLAAIIGGLLLIIILLVTSTASSCTMIGTGSGDTVIATSFTAEDEDILVVDDDYTDIEENLQEYIDDFETYYPGYDEYVYVLSEIGHNPFELAALLTVLYEDYSEAEVQDMLQTIYENQYVITTQERTESRTRTVYDEDTGTTRTEEFEYKIITLTVTNNGVDHVARSLGLNDDELERYELLLTTYGNKRYLFEDDIYAINSKGEYEDYKIPSEFLTDREFANMIKEAEKYLGKKYVWGGSNPDEGFDCSGFVSYVINHSGNGWNVGRPTANGLVNQCTKISKNNAKPGDLIFFKDTYKGAPSGASHVGIYVGNGMMIHCGNPIQYTSVETSFWKSHLYTYGRLDH